MHGCATPVTCLPCSVPVGEGNVCGYHTCPQTNGRSRRKEVITQTGLLPCPTYPPNRRLFAFRPEHVQEKERQLELELDHILNFRHATRRGTTCRILLYAVNAVRAAPCPCLPAPPTQPTRPFLGERGVPYYGDARLRGTDLSFHGSAAA